MHTKLIKEVRSSFYTISLRERVRERAQRLILSKSALTRFLTNFLKEKIGEILPLPQGEDSSVAEFYNYQAVAITCIIFSFPNITFAMDGHESQIFHAMKLETAVGASRDGTLSTWDLDGWIGGDINKLWLKSEGESLDGNTPEKAEYWAMYSRNIATFWDGQVGIRYDEQPNSTAYLVAGFEGLAPYLFETKAHLFVSDEGDVTAKLRQENDFLITQRLITQPYFEVNFSAQDVPESKIGAGLTSGEFGIQTRYEITRKFAPYIDLRYERKFGETISIAKKHGETQDDAIASLGLRLMF